MITIKWTHSLYINECYFALTEAAFAGYIKSWTVPGIRKQPRCYFCRKYSCTKCPVGRTGDYCLAIVPWKYTDARYRVIDKTDTPGDRKLLKKFRALVCKAVCSKGD